LTSTYVDDFNTVKSLGRFSGSTRTDDQTALAPFWDGNASVHWNQAANQMARANDLSMSKANRLLAVLNIAMADTMFTTWNGKRHYAESDTLVTWRPITAITLADLDFNPGTEADVNWTPLISTPSHPEYPAGHPSLNGAGATVLLTWFDDAQTFTLTTRANNIDLPSRTYTSISQARMDGNNARVWGGMHYPSTVAISNQLGETIANYINEHAMQPLHSGQ
jgi:membrane-associated phospholipid phosphatase